MTAELERVMRELRDKLTFIVLKKFPADKIPETRVATVTLAKGKIIPAGLGESGIFMAEMTFEVGVYDSAAEGCREGAREVMELDFAAGAVVGDAAYIEKLKRFRQTVRWTERRVLERGADEDAPVANLYVSGRIIQKMTDSEGRM